jgi:hypothetical protein
MHIHAGKSSAQYVRGRQISFHSILDAKASKAKLNSAYTTMSLFFSKIYILIYIISPTNPASSSPRRIRAHKDAISKGVFNIRLLRGLLLLLLGISVRQLLALGGRGLGLLLGVGGVELERGIYARAG